MKKLRRLITDPQTKELKMSSLYEYRAKVGTTGSTIVWLLDKAEKGKRIYGFCLDDRYSPYMKGHAFRYAEACPFLVSDIQKREDGDFIMISK